MDVKIQRRLAAEILKVGENRVWIDPDRIDDVSMASTREDIKRLISQGTIKSKQKTGISKARVRKNTLQRKKGRRRGHGSRKGTRGARYRKKERWINTIRPIRRRLRNLRDRGKITQSQYRELYLRAKGGVFRSVSHLEVYLRSQGILRK
ncbi:MAG: 50S ribosomal protein L19e [Candidatus Hydrothermarchaeota archaeon]